MKKLDNLKLFEEFGSSNEYHFYRHPYSTSVLYYAIPVEFNDELANDESFRIGFYGTPFKEYLSRVYDQPRHGTLQGKKFIQDMGVIDIKLPEWAEEKYNKLTLKDGKYYYEFDSKDIKTLGLD